MTDAEITALVERIVDEKLRERDRKLRTALSEGIARGIRDAEATVTLNTAELRKLARGD